MYFREPYLGFQKKLCLSHHIEVQSYLYLPIIFVKMK